MRLNIDCIRDIVLWAEELTSPRKVATYIDIDILNEQRDFLFLNPDDAPKPDSHQELLLKKYSNEELIYHLHYCVEAGLLALVDSSDNITIMIRDLTPLGHDFIGNIRHDPVYQKIKKVLDLLGVKTLDAAIQTSTLVVSELIKSAIL